MRFFSKITFICNLCFVASFILRLISISNEKKGNLNEVVALDPLRNSIVVLGLLAVIVNFLFCMAVLFTWQRKREIPVAKWMIWANLLFLLFQLYYSFLS
jgi:hypothetical protein